MSKKSRYETDEALDEDVSVSADDSEEDSGSVESLSSLDENVFIFHKNSRDYHKLTQSIRTKFAIDIIENAINAEVDMEEIGRIVSLLLEGLSPIQRNPRKLVHFLARISVGGNPRMLAALLDTECVELSIKHIVQLMYSQAIQKTTDGEYYDPDVEVKDAANNRFIAIVEQACEMGLLEFHEAIEEPLEELITICNSAQFRVEERRRLCRVCCGHAISKKVAGSIVQIFISDSPSTAAAAEFIFEVIKGVSFADIPGKMSSFWSALDSKEWRGHVESSTGLRFDKRGEVIYSDDSDVDKDGNLEGFIASEDEDSEHLSGSEQSSTNDSDGEKSDGREEPRPIKGNIKHVSASSRKHKNAHSDVLPRKINNPGKGNDDTDDDDEDHERVSEDRSHSGDETEEEDEEEEDEGANQAGRMFDEEAEEDNGAADDDDEEDDEEDEIQQEGERGDMRRGALAEPQHKSGGGGPSARGSKRRIIEDTDSDS